MRCIWDENTLFSSTAMCSKTRKREFDVKVNVNESRRLYEIFRGQCAICASDYYCACVSFILCDCCDHLPRSESKGFCLSHISMIIRSNTAIAPCKLFPNSIDSAYFDIFYFKIIMCVAKLFATLITLRWSYLEMNRTIFDDPAPVWKLRVRAFQRRQERQKWYLKTISVANNFVTHIVLIFWLGIWRCKICVCAWFTTGFSSDLIRGDFWIVCKK